MDLHDTDDVEIYAAAVGGFLETEPRRRNLMRTVIESVRGGASTMPRPPSFWWATDRDRVVGAASWSPPHGLLVSDAVPEAAEPLVESARRRGREIDVRVPGVIGPGATARLVAAAWEQLVGDTTRVHMVEILHQLDMLIEPTSPPGRWRRAAPPDVDFVADWFIAFAAEAGVVHVPDRARLIAHVVDAGRCFIWEDGGTPVSMACHNIPVAGVVRVGPVYTPPEFRMHGYGRRLTYEVTREALDHGARTTVLYTNASNPTSNSIYKQIGYLPLEEHLHIDFERSGGADLVPDGFARLVDGTV
jgi:GNAT superfamily N-acetyltransferase